MYFYASLKLRLALFDPLLPRFSYASSVLVRELGMVKVRARCCSAHNLPLGLERVRARVQCRSAVRRLGQSMTGLVGVVVTCACVKDGEAGSGGWASCGYLLALPLGLERVRVRVRARVQCRPAVRRLGLSRTGLVGVVVTLW